MPTTDIFLDGPDMEDGVYYPSSDGKPMAETDFHVLAIRLLTDALEDLFAERPDVYVAANVNWFWEQGNPKRRRAPDVMVVFGVERGPRRSFRSWNESGVVPAVCFEMASARTWRANLGAVRDDYESAGVQEYFIFDPTREYLEHPVIGFRRRGRRFHPVPVNEVEGVVSDQLGVCLVPERGMLRLVNLANGTRILTRAEQTAEARAERSYALARADQLEAEIERLKAQLKASGKTNGSK